MGPASTRRGRVVDATGAAVTDAVVSVVSGSAPTPEIAVLTDEAGGFSLGLPAGRYTVRAIAPDGASGSIEFHTDEARLEIVVRPAD